MLDISGTACIGKNSAVEFDIAIGLRATGTQKAVYATLTAKNPAGIGLPALLKAFDTSDNTEIPAFLNDLPTIQSLSLTYGTGNQSSEFSLAFQSQLTINGKRIDATIKAAYKKKQGADASYTFGGILRVGAHRFTLTYQKIGTAWYLYAAYLHKGTVSIGLREIVGHFVNDKNAIPNVSLTLDDFKAFLLYKKQSDGDTAFLFGMGAGLNLELKDLPLAGPLLAKEGAFAFKEVLALYASGEFKKDELQGFGDLPAVDIAAGFNISTQLCINGQLDAYVLNDGADTTYPTTAGSDTAKPAEVTSLTGTVASKAKWKKIDKKIGPVTVQRIGFLYSDGKVVLLMDASMLMAGMGMQLVGLGLGFKLEWKFPPSLPEFYIDGIGLSYSKDPIKISGMFVRAAPIKDVEAYSYYGGAQLSLSKFSISGIGAYSKLINPKPDGAISFFIYAMYAGAIGGPAFFFVTGVAAGFGYNRRVRVPAIREVNSFPLVSMALNPNPNQTINDVLGNLVAGDWIPASPGDYWLAIGIKFTSFKIIESFVLVIVQFGTHTEFTLLGLSVLAWPSKANAIAYVELAVKASFGSNSDVISVEAMLTPNSYVLDKNCKLTGGFAFYAWVSGEHEGDFVITLGGYHPKFKKPAHYPTVDRLGLNWRISNNLQIKGELYYALTPSAIMAGGRLEVTFSLSFLTASIVVWADMLIAWAPFQYAIDIGVSVRIEADIDMWLFTVHFKLEMGAQLHIWGPPFAGEAYVDWKIFSFTIPFGDAAKKKNQKMDWPGFKQQFIPANTNKKIAPEIIIGAGVINEYTVKTSTGEVKYLLVNPHQLQVNVEAPLPLTQVQLKDDRGVFEDMDAATPLLVDGERLSYANRNTDLGIRPMQETQLQSGMQVQVLMNGQPLQGDFAPEYSAYAAGVPESLWSHEQSKGSNAQPDETKVLKHALKGVSIGPKLMPVPKDAPQFDLNGKFEVVTKTLQWNYHAALTGPDNTAYSQPLKKIMIERYGDANITAKRAAMIAAALQAQGRKKVAADVDMQAWTDTLSAEPVIVQLGGLPQYKEAIGRQ